MNLVATFPSKANGKKDYHILPMNCTLANREDDVLA